MRRLVALAVLTMACADTEAPRDASSPRELDARVKDAPTPRDAASTKFDPPLDPRSFRVGFGSLFCEGDCPRYGLSVYSSGQVSFAGDQCVARPGVLLRTGTRAESRVLYDALVDAGYFALEDSYRPPYAVCPSASASEPVLSWVVEVDGQRKEVEHRVSCSRPELAGLEALARELPDRAGVRAWLEPSTPGCGQLDAAVARDYAGSYRLAHAGGTLGVLALDRVTRTWTLRDCAGDKPVEGRFSMEAERWILSARPAGPFELPGVAEQLGALWLSGDPRAPSVRAPHYEGAGEVSLNAQRGDGC